MEIINKMNNCSIELEGLKHLSEEQKSVCKTLREEIEKKRAELMRSPNALCTSLLGMFNQFERMSWDEILSNDFELINSVAEVENVSRIEVLNCILLLNPPKWKEFFWQQQYEKKTTEMLHLLFQFVPMKHDTPELIDAKKKARDEIRQNYSKEAERIKCANGGKKKAANDKDGKQAAKQFIYECWIEWKKNPNRYQKQSDFANDVLQKIPLDMNGNPIISFDTVTKRWIPQWQRAYK